MPTCGLSYPVECKNVSSCALKYLKYFIRILVRGFRSTSTSTSTSTSGFKAEDKSKTNYMLNKTLAAKLTVV